MTAPKLPEGLEPVAHPCDVSQAPLGFTNHEKSAWSIGCEEGLRSAQAALQALAAEKDAAIAALTREAWAWNQALTVATRGQFKARELIQKWRHAAENLGLEGLASLADCADELEAAIDSAIALAAKEAK